MNKKKGILILLLLSSFICLSFVIQKKELPIVPIKPQTENNPFSSIQGPRKKSIVPKAKATLFTTFSKGKESRLAIFLTDENSSWLGLVRGLQSIGVPFLITNDLDKALKHKVVFAYPFLSGKQLHTASKMEQIQKFLQEGGTLLTGNIYGALQKALSFQEESTSKVRKKLFFQEHLYTKDYVTSIEKEIALATTGDTDSYLTTTSFTSKKGDALAYFDDGQTAILLQKYGKGKVFLFGWDLGFFINRSYNHKQPSLYKRSLHQYIPNTEVFLHLLKEIYTKNEPNAVCLSPVPFNASLAVMVSHNIENAPALQSAQAFSEYEHSEQIHATYFMTTHYMKDYQEIDFFNESAVKTLEGILSKNMEIASHGVSLSNSFVTFPLGSGKEEYPHYKPMVVSKDKTEGASLFGELRISRFLLENLLHSTVSSFCPLYLDPPKDLPETLAACGYSFSSSMSASSAWTHLPFQLTYHFNYNTLAPVFEFPITLQNPPLSQTSLENAIELAQNISRYQGLFHISLDPDSSNESLEWERNLIDRIKKNSWFGSCQEMGSFWSARNQVSVDVVIEKNNAVLILDAKKPLLGLTLQIPEGWRLIQESSKPHKITQKNTSILMEKCEGKMLIRLEIPSANHSKK